MNPSDIYIKDLKNGQKNLNLTFIVLDIGKPNKTKEGHNVRTCRVADRSGSINMSIWDEIGDLLQPGDICRLIKGYTNVFRSCLTVYLGKYGELVKIGEFCLQFNEIPFMSEPSEDYISKQDPNTRRSPTGSGGNGGGNQPNGLPGNALPPLPPNPPPRPPPAPPATTGGGNEAGSTHHYTESAFGDIDLRCLVGTAPPPPPPPPPRVPPSDPRTKPSDPRKQPSDPRKQAQFTANNIANIQVPYTSHSGGKPMGQALLPTPQMPPMPYGNTHNYHQSSRR